MQRKPERTYFRAGISVFARNGYAATTLDDVARAAGCTRGAIYWHFRNKEAFYQETLQRLNRYYDELVNAALRVDGSPLDVVAHATTEVIRKFSRDREFRDMQELAMRTAIGGGDPAPGNSGDVTESGRYNATERRRFPCSRKRYGETGCIPNGRRRRRLSPFRRFYREFFCRLLSMILF